MVVSLSYHSEAEALSKETTPINYVPLGLWHKVCKIGGDELHRPAMVAFKSCYIIKLVLNEST